MCLHYLCLVEDSGPGGPLLGLFAQSFPVPSLAALRLVGLATLHLVRIMITKLFLCDFVASDSLVRDHCLFPFVGFHFVCIPAVDLILYQIQRLPRVMVKHLAAKLFKPGQNCIGDKLV